MKKRLNVDLIPAIRRFEIISKGLTAGKPGGDYKSIFKGKGLEFDGYRVYNPDDDADLIDWKATIRSDKILVKTYVEERDVNVFFLVDVSNSMIFGSTPKLKNEYAAEVIASLSYAILEAGDSVGLSLFTDKIVSKVHLGKGRTQFYALTRSLLNPEYYGGNFDFNSACKFLLNYLKQDSVVIVISDFVGLGGDWIRRLEMISKKFDVIGIMIRDPRDRTLPTDTNQIVIEDPYSNKSLTIEPGLIKDVYEDYIKKQEKDITNEFLRVGSDFMSLSTDKSFVSPIMGLFRKRGLRWR
ncbi:MAG: DUF58 domain-containing protein [Nanoarchaeota archaeon]|nr:DUF58 domain-containing protein [Nanoarchaeota archaeon]